MTQTVSTDPDMMTVIIPANNEEALLPHCLEAVLAQDDKGAVEVIVAANACTDGTVAVAESFDERFAARAWALVVLDLPDGGKLRALNAADAHVTGDMRVYLDADVICDPALFGQLREAMSVPDARYVTGTLAVARAQSWVTRAYARIWTELPFVKSGAVGAGLFAANGPGRARWGAFPDIISDDTYVRLQFKSDERVEVPARYHWPMVEGLQNLIKVRRRQDIGVAQVANRYPNLMANEGKARLRKLDLIGLAVRRPLGFAVYLTVHIMARRGRQTHEWTRGR
ncbi:glycosyltransferase [Yoonia sp. 2307UL14-13]|uniref:glycosyltransferase n=1 Tax=Yoonia sp. 2307UL14-13 TaxID=3126506 RepID=UPI0030A6FF42